MFKHAGDIVPDTPTRRALKDASDTTARQGDEIADTEILISAATCKPKKHIVADPDAPDAPVCKPPRYVTVDPDDPDAPVCKSPTYIVAPDPSTRRGALPEWGRSFGEDLAQRVR